MVLDRNWTSGQVAEHISQLPIWRGKARIAPLVGGLTNLNFLVEDDIGKFVTRIGFDNDAHDIYQPNVVSALRAAAGAGISPAVVYVSGALSVTEFMPGGTLNVATFESHETIREAVFLLKHLHSMGSNIPGPMRYSYPFQKIVRGCDLLLKSGAEDAVRIVELDSLSRTIETHVPAFLPSFVHTDLLPQNFVRDAAGALKLIDWDYAGIGLPLADLASLAANCEIPRSSWDFLFALYADREPTPGERKLFSFLSIVQALTEYLWGRVQEITSDLSEDAVAASMAVSYSDFAPTYEGYCAANFKRFETALAEHVSAFGPVRPIDS